MRLGVLQIAEQLQREYQLPDAMLAAGYVRNCYWDYLHEYPPTPLNDVDLIYFDPLNIEPARDAEMERWLLSQLPTIVWDVKNQARMAGRHGDPDYVDSLDAMRYWPERETAVAVRLHGSRELVSPFGFGSLFEAKITPGPHRLRALCEERACKKGWLRRWPKLQLVT